METSQDLLRQLVPQYVEEGEWQKLMEQAVREKLDHNFEELKQILYRLDVSEMKVRRVFQHFPVENWPAELAKLILERERQRLEFRKKYSEGKS